jgi:large repetitive protein
MSVLNTIRNIGTAGLLAAASVIGAGGQAITPSGHMPGSPSQATQALQPQPLAMPVKGLPDGYVHLPFRVSVLASGGAAPYQMRFSGNLPDGVSSEAGPSVVTIGGVPTEAGSFDFQVTVTDVNGYTMSHDYTVQIHPLLGRDPVEVPVNDAEAIKMKDTENVFFPAVIQLSEGMHIADGMTDFGAKELSLLESMAVNDVISVFFGSMIHDSEPLKLTEVDNISLKIGLLPAVAPSAVYNVPYSASFTAVGYSGRQRLSHTGTLPEGLAFTTFATSVTITGTPTQTGKFPFSISAFDGEGGSGTTTIAYTLTVPIASQTITFGSLANTPLGVGSVVLTAKASSGLPVSYAVTGPATVSGSTLTITGAGPITVTPSQAGNSNYLPVTGASQSFTAAGPLAGTVVLITTSTLQTLNNGSYVETVSVVNNGTATAQNVVITTASLGAATAPLSAAIPRVLGNILPGSTVVTSFSFASNAGAAGSSTTQHIGGTYTGGSFGGSFRVLLPESSPLPSVMPPPSVR